MKLKEARFCVDCEEIFVGRFCPVCGGENWMNIGQWLNRPEDLAGVDRGRPWLLKGRGQRSGPQNLRGQRAI